MRKLVPNIAACLLLSVTALAILPSCKKEDAVDPVAGILLTAKVSVPEDLLMVADVTMTVSAPDSLFVDAVNARTWTRSYYMKDSLGFVTAPLLLNVSMEGKEMAKGKAIDAGIKYEFGFETVFESGARIPIVSFKKTVSGHVIWLPSERRYGSLEPFNYVWRGEIISDPTGPAKYSIQELEL